MDALGRENVVGVSMPSRYSSEGSVADSKALAERLGMELWVVPIEPAHAAFLDMLEPHFRGVAPNLAEENVQARIRGNLLMTMANKFGWLVLTTGNKSETAMGYATLYGDMAGGFAVIKDVPKTLVYDLSRWRNEHGNPRDVIPQAVLEKPPSAELKPDQKDQDTLPPYEVLDPIVKAYVEDDLGLQEIVDMGFDREMVRGNHHGHRPQRIQAETGPAGHQDHAQGLRQGPPPAHREPVQAVVGSLPSSYSPTSTIISISMQMPLGRPPIPTAERAWAPRSP